MPVRILGAAFLTTLALGATALAPTAQAADTPGPNGDPLGAAFRNPPAEAGPWTYWFWINGNITSEGITADLEAMARVGIRGVLIMEVAGAGFAPAGPVAFGSPQWRALFKHAVAEAKRLGMQLNMNNDAGWCGSGGPWNTPEYSMQKLVSTQTRVPGGQRFEGVLPRPREVAGFYRDLKVFAYPDAGNKKPEPAVPQDLMIDLGEKMDATGKLTWEAPKGNWIALRIGHTSTGRKNHPAPADGLGLECDKFSAEAMKRHFEGFIARLADDVGADAGDVFTMTHIDSWEVMSQNWTPRMAEEFRSRRGYDLTPWLVSLAGGPPVGSVEQTERFRWDFHRTQAELTTEAYAGALRELAKGRGMRLSIEGYGPNGDVINPLTYGAQADLPMGEFWVMRWGAWHLFSSRLLASVAHVHGKPVVGAESFTSAPLNDAWTEHPYSIKTTGDWAFCEGINRFVFHRTVMNPWTTFVPSMSMRGYGTHFDRTQTWWEQGAAFMRYLTRCQYLLQKGQFVADVCRLLPDGENYGHSPKMNTLPGQYAPLPVGYNYDYVSDAALLTQASVRDGRILLQGGMNYRLLQLPKYETMTPELLRKLRDLVRDGAVIVGPRPKRSPSLREYPQCDQEVETLAAQMWGESASEHHLGVGRVISGRPMEEVLLELTGGADFAFKIDPPLSEAAIESPTIRQGSVMGKERPGLMPTPGLNWIHRRIDGADAYFVANPQHRPVEALCTFRVKGKQPELWDPVTGEIHRPAVFAASNSNTEAPIHFDPAGSVFVVFREDAAPETQVVAVKRRDDVLFGPDRQTPAPLPSIRRNNRAVKLQTREPGRYELTFAGGSTRTVEVSAPPTPSRIVGPWKVEFQPGRGAPLSAEFPALVDWSKHPTDEIRYFSGTARCHTQFDWQPSPQEGLRWQLDLGDVREIAEVTLNGRQLGTLWKPPFAVDVTNVLKAGQNDLEVRVTNLWPNRLIGDEQFPDDCTPDGSWTTGPIPAWPEWVLKNLARPEPRRVTFTTWKYYTKDSALLPSGLLGPVALRAEQSVTVQESK